MKIPVIIMAGGKGERLGEVTKNIPKPMVEVAGKPYLEHLIMQLLDNGLDEFIISAGYKAEIIEEFYSWRSGANLDMDFQSRAELKRSLRNFIENI